MTNKMLSIILSIAVWVSPQLFAQEVSGTYIEVQIKGILHIPPPVTEEMTGVEIHAAGAVWELEFKTHRSLDEPDFPHLTDLDGKMVFVTGEYFEKKGLEKPKHRIVLVESLRIAEDSRSKK